MVRKKLFILFIMQCLHLNVAIATISDEILLKDKECVIKTFKHSENDLKQASLIRQVILKKDVSGRVQGVYFYLLNNSNKSVIIETRPNVLEHLYIHIISNNGQTISKKYEELRQEVPGSDRRVLKYKKTKLFAGENNYWFIDFMDIFEKKELTKAQIKKGVEGLLIINFFFKYYIDDKECTKQIKKESFAFKIENILFSLTHNPKGGM